MDVPGNGYLEPGESGGLVTVIKNFGASAAGVTANLTTQDPYITVDQADATFGDLPEGAVADNMAEPFMVSASPNTPPGYSARLTLGLSYGGGTAICELVLCVGAYDYLVWEHSTDQSGGPVLSSTLASLGYVGDLTTVLPLDGLHRYRALFVSCGMYSDNFIINSDSPQAWALLDYLNSGGGLYLEGGEVWFEDPQAGGQDFGTIFGITTAGGGSGMMPLVGVEGIAGTFAQGMTFGYGGDNFHVDELEPAGDGFTLLQDPFTMIRVGVAREEGPGRTVGTSFEFAGLVDGAPPSTKAELAQALMEFLTVPGPQHAPDEPGARVRGPWQSYVAPNPWAGSTLLHYELPQPRRVTVDLFDSAGRQVMRLAEEHQPAGIHAVALDGAALTPGMYLIRLQAGADVSTRKCVIVR